MPSTFRKILSTTSVIAALAAFNSANAEMKDVREYLNFDTDVVPSAKALVKEIRDDHNNNHSPIPGHNAYKDLSVVSVDPNFTGFFEVDDQTKLLKHVEFSTVAFQAVGVPLFSNYAATLKLTADFNADCTQIVEGSRAYTVVKSNSSLVDALFKKDLTGRSYNTKYYAYGDVVFESMFQTNEKMRELCPNFVAHTHPE